MSNNLLVYRLFGDLCAADIAAAVVGGWAGTGGGPVDLIGVGGVVCGWTARGEEDVGDIDVQTVGWRSVAVVACGWNNVPNCVVVVVVVPDAGSNNGLRRDEPKFKWWNDGWRLNDDISVIRLSSLSLLPNHRRRNIGTRKNIINTVNVTKRTIQNAATIVFVNIRLSNIFWVIIIKIDRKTKHFRI